MFAFTQNQDGVELLLAHGLPVLPEVAKIMSLPVLDVSHLSLGPTKRMTIRSDQ